MLFGALAAACVACAIPAYASTAAATCTRTYSYAGMTASTRSHGISAVISPMATPEVAKGHVAGWVGVGGPGKGPNGSDEWLQTGLTSVPSEGTNSIYYELVRPGHRDVTHMLRHHVAVGEQHAFAVRAWSRKHGVSVVIDEASDGYRRLVLEAPAAAV